jgi:hypothetical protein
MTSNVQPTGEAHMEELTCPECEYSFTHKCPPWPFNTSEAQEWTVKRIEEYENNPDLAGFWKSTLAFEINAALAAERRRVLLQVSKDRAATGHATEVEKIALELKEELAAEREKRIEAERERDEFSKGCDQLAEKLSYERMKQSSETRGLQL